MAKPQLEHGYTPIANSIIEALAKTNLSPYESSIIWTIIRLTFGWGETWVNISYIDFQEHTDINDNWHLWRTIRKLQSRNIIQMRSNGQNSRQYCLQKDYDLWTLSPVEATSPKEATGLSPKEATGLSPKEATHRKTNLKQIKQDIGKPLKSRFDNSKKHDPKEHERRYDHLLDRFRE